MIELHEQLSEFSYGYGVTREVERLLVSIGTNAVPFLPSLVQEAKLGFDVGFDKPGAVLLLQFKLGQCLSRYVRKKKTDGVPYLDRPFWRYKIDTAEPAGQFETLFKAEQDHAEVYYVAPRFADWSEYVRYFEAEEVLEKSLMIRPSEIRAAIDMRGDPDGVHSVLYDGFRRYVRSEPVSIDEVSREQLAANVRSQVFDSQRSLAQTVREIVHGFERVPVLRMPVEPDVEAEPEEEPLLFPPTIEGFAHRRIEDGSIPRRIKDAERRERLASYLSTARTEEDAYAMALGVETWSMGAQMLLVTEAKAA